MASILRAANESPSFAHPTSTARRPSIRFAPRLDRAPHPGDSDLFVLYNRTRSAKESLERLKLGDADRGRFGDAFGKVKATKEVIPHGEHGAAR